MLGAGTGNRIHFTHLPRIVGRHVAFDLLFTGRAFSAEEAMTLHLVNRVIPEHQVLAEARALAQALAAKSRSAMTIGRAAFHRAVDSDYRRGVSYAVDTFCQVAATSGAREGIAAFVEQRRPRWPD
ncbi:enoyl-CoA hydratase-related protein [Cupriavidus necator]|uniref:enoyl-CoA hydratase/isomerase family protein n=1 Tax=Cupriavidus necator TaxID=106590 RepID=UPI00339D874B